MLLSFTVTNTNSTGAGSLAKAIQDVNNNGGGTIDFDIGGGGAQTIWTNGLPALSAPAVLDGTSQPGFSSRPLITLGGPGSGTGLTIEPSASGTTVRGLMITEFATGVLVAGASNNTVARNVISGNGIGIVINGNGGTGNLVAGNKIGTDATGTVALANNAYGIEISGGASGNTIGGTSSSNLNVISGNSASGILISDTGSNGNLIQGNRIGTGVAGYGPVSNGANGVIIDNGASDNTIGGLVAGAANVISSNQASGVAIGDYQTSNNVVEGNFIGTNLSGTGALPNEEGVNIYEGASNNTIGGTTVSARNIISGNLDNGVDIHDSGTTGNRVRGNFIGTGIKGIGPIPNEGDGVLVVDSASHNTIGGVAAGAGNTIAFNIGNGIAIGQSSTEEINGVSVYANLIFGNAQLGISLGDNGLAPNVPPGVAYGPNVHVNFPIVTSASTNGSTLTIQGNVVGSAGSVRRIEFYATAPNPAGYAPVEIFLGAVNVWTNSSGIATFTAQFRVSLQAGSTVRASASDGVGNSSEFTAVPMAVTGV